MEIIATAAMPWEPTPVNTRGGKVSRKILREGELLPGLGFYARLVKYHAGEGVFTAPRHKHNYDQIRYTISGTQDFGQGPGRFRRGLDRRHGRRLVGRTLRRGHVRFGDARRRRVIQHAQVARPDKQADVIPQDDRVERRDAGLAPMQMAPHAAEFPEAIAFRKPIAQYKPKGAAAKAIKALADELLARVEARRGRIGLPGEAEMIT